MQLSRITAVRQALVLKNIDALLVSNFYNILYLTGFKTLTTNEREAFALVTKNNVYLFTDARYQFEDPQVQLKLFEPHMGLSYHLLEIIKSEDIKTVGFESEDLKYQEHSQLKEKLNSTTMIPFDRLIILIREIKDNLEIEKVRQVCRAGDSYFSQLLKTIKVGMSEKEIAFRLETIIREKGDDLAFDPIVATDTNASLPHYNTKTGSGVLKDSSVLLVDFGVKREDYLSDTTRMIFMKKCSAEILSVYEKLRVAQEKTLEKISNSSTLGELDIFCRAELLKDNLPEYSHSTGHGVGLEIHEYPKVYRTSPDLKKAGQILTIEPGVYKKGQYGMRVEDTIVVTNEGYEALTSFSKDLLVL